jgi:hypothetical protein
VHDCHALLAVLVGVCVLVGLSAVRRPPVNHRGGQSAQED